MWVLRLRGEPIRQHGLRSEANEGTLRPKDNSLVRKEASTRKGFHSTLAALLSLE